MEPRSQTPSSALPRANLKVSSSMEKKKSGGPRLCYTIVRGGFIFLYVFEFDPEYLVALFIIVDISIG